MFPLIITEIEDADHKLFMEGLYETTCRLMYHVAKKWTDSATEQEDIVQDSLVKLISKISLLRDLSKPQQISYVAHTVRNTAITYLDRRMKEERWITSLDLGDEREILPSQDLSPEELLLSGEWRESFRQVWAEMPERERLLLEGKYVFRASDKELAQWLGCRPSSVRMALTRAKRMVIEKLERRQKDESSRKTTGTI